MYRIGVSLYFCCVVALWEKSIDNDERMIYICF